MSGRTIGVIDLPDSIPEARCPVLVIDDHELTGGTMVLALQNRGLEAHYCAVSGRSQILKTAAALPPGLVLLDLELGTDADGSSLRGVDLIADLQADGWRVVVLSGHTDQDQLAAAVMAGAEGVFLKSTQLTRFLDLIEQAVSGRLVMPPAERRRWVEQHRRHRARTNGLELLTVREREVLDHLAAGRRAATIASSCGLSVTTVRTHIRAVLAKLKVSSQLEAVAVLRAGRSPR